MNSNCRPFWLSTTAAVALALISGLAAVADEAPPAATPFVIKGDAAKGAETYKLYCVACHGEKGAGDGAAAVALNPKPRNFTDKVLMATIPDAEIFKAIKEGGAAVGKSPLMVPWGGILGDDQKVHDVAAYVRSLGK